MGSGPNRKQSVSFNQVHEIIENFQFLEVGILWSDQEIK